MTNAGFVPISASDDERLAPFRLNERGLASRADKRDDAGAGLFMAEGDLVVERALAGGCTPYIGLVDDERPPDVAHALVEAGATVYAGGEQVRQMVTKLGMPQTIVALFHRPARPAADDLARSCQRLVIAEGVDNPVNVGSIVRNAAALGWQGLLLDHTSADPLSRRALRVAMGTAFSLPHARTTSLIQTLEAAAGAGMTLFALTPDPTAADLRSVTPAGPRAVVIGSERAGLSAEALAACTTVRIPMAGGVDSLNAAAAAAVACYALA